jgi:DNA topoisomerase IA
MTPQAIRDGFDAPAQRQQMLGLADAARSRSRPTGWWASTARAP